MRIIACSLFVLFSAILSAQSYIFGPKFGPVIANQRWEGFQRDPLLDMHAMMFIETYDEDSDGSLFAQLGYHRRGSALRNLAWNPEFGIQPASRVFRFNNLVLTLGAKKVFSTTGSLKSFYAVGIRGEYTINTNLDEFAIDHPTFYSFYPQDAFVMHFNYGLYAAAGFEFALSDLVGLQIDLSVNPDISRQYFQPPIPNVQIYTFQGPQYVDLAQREIRNLSFEVSFGFRFLRLVEYID